ncbi:Mitochondrial dicarboxylate/tricarboxylate transporter DTC [Capsicum chinense]|nr:Mitochondrial dicarboxylate/tricarboxylate transporter DTC [Capsicum chinense]
MEEMIEGGIKMGRIVSFATLKATTQAIQKGSGSVRETKNEEDGSGENSVSGFFAAACSLPCDYVKTQIQKMQPDAEGKFPYSCSFDCAMNTLKAGGPFKFYTGFPVYCIRIAPHVMMTWIFLNQI